MVSVVWSRSRCQSAPTRPALAPGTPRQGWARPCRVAVLVCSLTSEYPIVWRAWEGPEGERSQGVRLQADGEGDEGLGVSLGASVPEPGLERGPKSLLPAEWGLGMSPGATQAAGCGGGPPPPSTPPSPLTSTALSAPFPALAPHFLSGQLRGELERGAHGRREPRLDGRAAAGLSPRPGLAEPVGRWAKGSR